MKSYTALCAQLERRADEMEAIADVSAPVLAWELEAVTALRKAEGDNRRAAAAIRELEEQNRDLALDVLAASGQAQDAYEAQLAAEAKIADYEREDVMKGAIVRAIRLLLNSNDVPGAAFIDDHVANAIAQRDESRAKLAEVEKERDEWRHAAKAHAECQKAAEATVATLTAQLEAMRGADWRCCGCGSPPPFNCQCTTEVAYRANTNGKSETSLKAQVARAALTKENQTNG